MRCSKDNHDYVIQTERPPGKVRRRVIVRCRRDKCAYRWEAGKAKKQSLSFLIRKAFHRE